MSNLKTFNCPIDATLSFIGGKYKAIILCNLIKKTFRFNELQKLIPQATTRMLIQQLRELESDELIIRKVYSVVPPKTEYSLSEFGKSAIPVIEEMRAWGNNYIQKIDTQND